MATCRRAFLLTVALLLSQTMRAGEAIPNWPAPAFWAPPKAHGVTTLSDATNPLPFIGLPPCRIVDTRGTVGVPINTGGAFSANEIRTWTITGLCGLPVSAGAVSLNVTVTNTGNNPFGFIKIWPGGGTEPNVSTLNWSTGGVTESNAAIVPLGTSPAGSISVESANASSDVIIDINGYYSNTTAGNRLAAGEFFGIFGTRGGDGVVHAENDSAAASSSGIKGVYSSSGSGGSGVEGNATGTGVVNGVFGRTLSTSLDAAGVFGMDASGPGTTLTGFLSAGVRGESATHIGVRGVSRYLGTLGDLYDSTGSNLMAEGLLGTTFGTAAGPFTGPWGVFSNGDFGATGAKHFVEPHPEDPNKVILFSSLEGNEVGTYFRARGRCVDGVARIAIPESFAMVTDENNLSVQATAIGQLANFAVMKLDLNEVVLECSRNVEVFVTINGVRRAYKDFQSVANGMEFIPRSADARMPAYLTEEAKRRLIANGTYNPDGTVNLQTAQRAGWTKLWKEQEDRDKALAAANAAR